MKRQIATNEAEIAALKAVNEALTAKKLADELPTGSEVP